MIPRLVVLWCPNWPVACVLGDGDAAGVGDQPVAVLQANRVIACSLAANAHGVTVGMRRRQAQSRCPSLRIETSDPDQQARQFELVVTAISAMVPRIEVVEPGMLVFAARGPSRYFGGDASMAGLMVRTANSTLGAGRQAALGGFGLGLANGRFAATVAARCSAQRGQSIIVDPGVPATANFLAPLSIRHLGALTGARSRSSTQQRNSELIDVLHQLGIARMGQLAALDAADVLARFGSDGAFAHRVCTGGDDRPPDTTQASPGVHVQRVFDDPVHHLDTVVFVGRHLAEALGTSLAQQGQVCTRLVVIAETDHGERIERVWYRPEGLSVAAITERIRWQLDAWVQQAGITAGITLLQLQPEQVRSDDGVQLGLWGGRTQADEWAQRAVARLVAVAGEQQVLVPVGHGGRQPDDTYRWTPAVTADLADGRQRLQGRPGPWPGQLPSPSPATIFARSTTSSATSSARSATSSARSTNGSDQSAPIDVVDKLGQSVRINGRGMISASPQTLTINGAPLAITAWAGPWPLEERWWDVGRSRRSARFQVLTADGVLRLVAVEHQRWQLDAVYT